MSLGQLLASGAAAVFNPGMFLMVCVAIILGTIFGALPGVSATMAVALGLTFTYTMEPIPAIVFLVAIYCSSITGGSITAILFKIPGVPSSAPTTFDGYPMAQRGEAGKALGVALLASAIGGLFSAIAMFLLSQPLTKAALQFGPSDLFAVTFMGLSILTCLDSDHILTCIISGLLGLLMACVGQDKMYAVQRLTFGSRNLLAGIDMIPVLIGLFAVTEVFKQTDPKKKRLSAEDGWPEDWRNLGTVALFGDLDVEGATEELARSYAQLIADGVAPDDPSLPEGLRDSTHRSGIGRLVVRGSEVPLGLDDVDGLDDAENPFQRDLIAHGEDGVARWDEGRGTYVMRVDVGDPRYSTTDEEPVAAHSWLVEQVALLAGGSYEQDGSSFSWRCGDASGTVTLRTDPSGVTDALLTLDGQTMLLRQDDLAGGAARYALVDVAAFARRFGLAATVDEKNGVIALS